MKLSAAAWIILCLGLIVAIAGLVFLQRKQIKLSYLSPQTTSSPSNASAAVTKSGSYLGGQTWEGDILVTGDVEIIGDLTVKPGTTVKFAVSDDRQKGDETPADGYNDLDPTRLKSYTTTHSALLVVGKLLAQGTAEQPITFTSASSTPKLADWQGLVMVVNGSQVDHVRLEWSRHGLVPHGTHDKTVIQNSDFHHNLWAGISAKDSSPQILNNKISDCGHEGIDFQPGSSQAIVRGNTVTDCNTGVVVLGGSPTIDDNVFTNVGAGITVDPKATPKIGNNTTTLADPASTMEWRYGNFAYHMYKPSKVDSPTNNDVK